LSYRPITDIWILARCKYQGGHKRPGGYLGGFPERARALLGVSINDPVLHVCGGLARLYPYKGGFGPHDKTLDLDPQVGPDYLQSALVTLPSGFRAMLADPPNDMDNAAQYPPGVDAYPPPTRLLANMLRHLEPGQRAGIIHFALPSPPPDTRFVACVGVVCGFNNRMRCFSVFEKGEVANG
jgi:hypothetical protein